MGKQQQQQHQQGTTPNFVIQAKIFHIFSQ